MKKKTKKLLREFSFEFDKGETSFFHHLIAGSCAGIAEHSSMFPVDVIKTRLMAGRCKHGFFSTFYQTARHSRGCLFRGMHIAILGSIPSHAALFATYEFLKRISPRQNSLFYGLSGVGATMFHDLFANCFGVIKTRIMLRNRGKGFHRGRGWGGRTHGYRMFRRVLAEEGFRAFFISYPISLLMNIPFVVGYFTTYELLKQRMKDTRFEKFSPLICGGIAGGVAGWISNPFDVIRVRMQNQSTRGVVQTAKFVYRKYGIFGFLYGSTARAIYYIPSGTITWFTYETVKNILRNKQK